MTKDEAQKAIDDLDPSSRRLRGYMIAAVTSEKFDDMRKQIVNAIAEIDSLHHALNEIANATK